MTNAADRETAKMRLEPQSSKRDAWLRCKAFGSTVASKPRKQTLTLVLINLYFIIIIYYFITTLLSFIYFIHLYVRIKGNVKFARIEESTIATLKYYV